MTVRIAGLWELGWNTPIKELDLWQYPLQDFAVDRLYMSPVSGIASNAVCEIDSIQKAIEISREDDFDIVFIDEKGSELLSDFIHPDKVLYVFGKASESPMPSYKKESDRSLKIRTVANSGLLWPHQAAVIVLYDRMNKLWQ